MTLTAGGAYLLNSLDLEPGAHIVLPNATVSLFVRDAIIALRGSLATANGAAPLLTLGFQGTQPVFVDTAFTGTILAPNAKLNLDTLTSGQQYQGQFFAKDIEAFPDVTIIDHPANCP